MNKHQLRSLIAHVLTQVNMYSPEAVELLMGTAAVESRLGEYIRQMNAGPALGIFQMEPETFRDIIKHYLRYKPALYTKILAVCKLTALKPEMLEYNLQLAIIFARLQYRRRKEPLPSVTNLFKMAAYWKTYYNTQLGAGQISEFVKHYNELAK